MPVYYGGTSSDGHDSLSSSNTPTLSPNATRFQMKILGWQLWNCKKNCLKTTGSTAIKIKFLLVKQRLGERTTGTGTYREELAHLFRLHAKSYLIQILMIYGKKASSTLAANTKCLSIIPLTPVKLIFSLAVPTALYTGTICCGSIAGTCVSITRNYSLTRPATLIATVTQTLFWMPS